MSPRKAQGPKVAESRLRAYIKANLNLLSDVLLWDNDVIHVTLPGGAHKVVGQIGQGDLAGLGPGGCHLELEIKTDAGQQEPAQVAHAARVRGKGGFYFVVRSLEEARAAVEAVRAELAARGRS